MLTFCECLGLSPISLLGHLRDDPFISPPSHSFPGLGTSKNHESSRRATPALPPGLSFPAQSTLSIAGAGQVEPSIATDSTTDSPARVDTTIREDNKLEQAAVEVVSTAATTDTASVDSITASFFEPSFADRLAFPALPKLGTPSTALDNKPIKVDSRKIRNAAQATTTDDNTTAAAVGGTLDSAPDATRTQRQHPGKLDISAATTNLVASVAGIHITPVSDLPPGSTLEGPAANSQPTTPAITLETPVKRATQPRTLRVLPNPVIEAPPAHIYRLVRDLPL